LWRGNMATVVRIFPYAAIQFMTFSQIKQVWRESVWKTKEVDIEERG
jgi:hypothetical protein